MSDPGSITVHSELTDRSDRLSRLLDAVLVVAADLSLPVVLHRITESACALAGARFGALGVVGPDQGLSDFITVGASFDTVEAIGSPPKGHGILGLLITEPTPLRLRNLSDHPRMFGFPSHHPIMTSFLGVPVRVRGEVFGNLYLCDKQGGPEFTAEDEELVVALAAAAGVAIENARLHARVREYAVIEDRERIARDLHDTIIQRLFATGMALQASARMLGDTEVARRIQYAVDDLDETIRDIRSTIFALGAAERRGAGLRAEMLALAAEATPALGFEPRVVFDGPIDSAVSEGIGEHLRSVVREALTNVARHAHGTSVTVRLIVGEDVVLTVIDNGRGLDPDRPEGGLGLGNLRARARALGGDLAVGPGPDGLGTALEWRVPLHPESS